jgi:thiol reductant ABC exporter CydD subunit
MPPVHRTRASRTRPVDPRLLKASPAARRFVIACVPLGLVAAAATIVQAAALGGTVDRVVLKGAGLSTVAVLLAALAAASVVRGLAAWAFEAGGHLASAAAARDLRAALVRSVLADDAAEPPRDRARLAVAATSGVDALDPYFARYLPSLVLSVVGPVAILAAVAVLDIESAILMAVTLPLIPVFGILVGRTAEHRARVRYDSLKRLSGHFLDVVSGLATLRAFNRGEAQVDRIARTGEAYRRETMATLRVAFLSAFVLELAAVLATALVAVEIGIRLDGGGIGFAPALTILVLAPELYAPLRTAAAQFHASTDGLAAADALLEAAAPPAGAAASATPLDPRDVPVRLEHVTLTYEGRDRPALNDVSLTLWPAERVALVGRSGAGKSSVASLLLRFTQPGGGRLLVGDADLASVDAAAWRRMVAWVPQRPHVTSGSLLDAVRLGRPDAPISDVDEAAQRAGLRELVATLPGGWDTRVGEGGRRLSAGEVRRMALARALVCDAPLTVLDEPTASLDADNAERIGDALTRLPRTGTALLITHDLELARRWADRVIEIEDGHILPGRSGRLAEDPA